MEMSTRTHLLSGFIAFLLVIGSSAVVSQTTWNKFSGNPVLPLGLPGAWDANFAVATTVLLHDGVLKMWYEGDDSFGFATSDDGVTWVPHPANPVMEPGPPAEWDGENIDNASVVVVADTFHMFYSAVDDNDENRIGHATSPDGLVWTKDPANPVLDHGPGGSWDDQETMHPFVLYEEPVFRMWYNGHDGITQRILYATSPDGTNWTRFTAHPMLENGSAGTWDESELGPLCVLRINDTYHMWYTGWNQAFDIRIGYATSPDGIDWTKDEVNNPVLGPGDPGSWDDLMTAIPNVMLINSVLTMWYGGTDGLVFQTGLATDMTLVPALLQSSHAEYTDSGIEITWRLSQAGAGTRFFVWRNEPPGGKFVELRDAEIVGDRLAYSFTDRGVEPGKTYRYRIDVSDEDGSRTLFQTEPVATPVLTLAIRRVLPNPFNPQTSIEYSIDEAGAVTLAIYDASGRLVRALVDKPQDAGRYTASWDGTNDTGSRVASGVYFVRLESAGRVRTQKVVLAK
jgi:predicted GH43/DUF377 family glycosyl hydrolase